MKLSSSLLLLASASVVSADVIRSSAVKRTLVSKSRRVEDAGDDAAEEEEMAFLKYYSIKLLSCVPGEQYQNVEGNYEYSSIVYRLCPADSCSDDISGGCTDGYADYVVGINTYVDNWLEDKRENMQADDNFDIQDYAECREYDFNANNNNNNGDDDGNQVAYYVGPKCSDDGKSVLLGFFSDETCQTVPDVTFEDMSSGWSLPYSSSGLVTNACESCSGYNDNGEFEISEMCANDWMYSGKCEGLLSYPSSAYGADESACEYIASISPQQAKASNAGAAIGWTIFVLVVLGAGGYAYATWWMKKKSAGGMANDGAMN